MSFYISPGICLTLQHRLDHTAFIVKKQPDNEWLSGCNNYRIYHLSWAGSTGIAQGRMIPIVQDPAVMLPLRQRPFGNHASIRSGPMERYTPGAACRKQTARQRREHISQFHSSSSTGKGGVSASMATGAAPPPICSSCQRSLEISSCRGLEPSKGPTTPFSSIWSTSRAARP